MPFGEYDHKKIIKQVQKRAKNKESVRHLIQKKDKELELKDMDHKLDKAKLKKHEDVEKRRLEGLKKAQANRKKTTKSAKTKTTKSTR